MFAVIKAADACVCTGVPMNRLQQKNHLRDEVTKAVAVFVGRVVITSELQATLAVTDTWKGDLPAMVTMPTGSRREAGGVIVDNSCDWRYRAGQRYLIFAYGSSVQSMKARQCTPTTLLDFAAPTMSILDELTPRRNSARAESGEWHELRRRSRRRA